ncbi:cytochrome P450 2M1-like isoform X1 [Anguilla anguilla]|uniref:cytochrome P450 2M1-like isoform X1 n=1 Tax=Anguilla anguilla TaxID=7936 RepID=UPI0015AD123F|nr:cytochrome P450 2M1-like isoform X1 [Anguilla anguilla]
MYFLSLLANNVIGLLLGLIVLVLFWKNMGKKSNTARLPPGPSPVPILGNIFQVDLKQPYKSYSMFSKKYGSVFTVWLGPRPVVVLSGFETLKEALLNQGEEFSGRAGYPILLEVTKGFGVLASSGGRWRDLRRFSIMTLKNFGMGRRSIEERVQEEVGFLIKAFSEYGDSVFNPNNLLCNAVSNVICSIVFGQRFEYNDPQFKFLQQGLDGYFNFLSSSKGQLFNVFPKLVWCLPGPHHHLFKHIESIREYFKQEAQRRMKNLNTDSPQDFIEAFLVRMLEQGDKPGSEFHFDNLVSSIWSLFSAGTETTTSTLRQALLLMMKYPHVQERVQKEIDQVVGSIRTPSLQDRQNMPYTDAVIHEVQRSMDLAPTSVPHKMMSDTEFKGYCIPQGTMVLPLLSSVLSDPKLWKNPDVFDPENFLNENGSFKKNDGFLAFGLGKRACLGEGLARVELFLYFSTLLQRFTFTATQPPEELDINPACCSFGRLPRMYTCYAKLRE